MLKKKDLQAGLKKAKPLSKKKLFRLEHKKSVLVRKADDLARLAKRAKKMEKSYREEIKEIDSQVEEMQEGVK